MNHLGSLRYNWHRFRLRVLNPLACRSDLFFFCRPSSRPSHGPSMVVAAPPPPTSTSSPEDQVPSSGFDYGAPPPFTLADIRNAIPKQCWEKDTWRSLSFLARDVLMVSGLAAAAFAVDSWTLWPLYWLAQGTMFWALFVVGHEW